MKKYISPAEGQERSGVHPDTIREALRRGDLKGFKRGMGRNARWLIPVTEFDQWLQGGIAA